MRKFEIISKEQWDRDIKDGCDISELVLPSRATKRSAGYDFTSPIEITIKSHEMATIPTGVKVCMESDEMLSIYPRSGMGFKTGIRLANTVGIIDSDYYNNPSNEGHIYIKFYNPTGEDYKISIGDKIAQGVFTKYLTVESEEEILEERVDGLGSTGK